jgi:hypothetical protein
MRGLPPPTGSKVADFGYHSQTADITFGEGDDYHLEINGVPQATTCVVEDIFEVARDAGLYSFPVFKSTLDSKSGGPIFDETGHLVGTCDATGFAKSYIATLWPMLRIPILAKRAGHPTPEAPYPAIDLAFDGTLALSDLKELNPGWFPGRTLR